jgi:hypothetical protein
MSEGNDIVQNLADAPVVADATPAPLEAKTSSAETPAAATMEMPEIAAAPDAAASAPPSKASAWSPDFTAPSPSNRFALLAASVAFAAAIGAVAGSLGTMGLARTLAPSASTDASKQANASANLQPALAQVSATVAELKASLEASNRAANTQFSKLAERFERTERAQAEPAGKLSAIADSLSRLEQRVAASAAHDVTGSVERAAARPEAKEPAKPSILEGWVIRDVYRGRALVQNRNSLFEIAPGSNLPGIGRVETITQQNGRWIVVTPKGLIVSMR